MLGPKEKRERALGIALGLKGDRAGSPKSALVRKPYRPGVHGPKSTGTNAASSVSVNCSNPTSYDVSYSTSQAPNATATKWNTDGPATDSPGHALLSNSAYNVNWGRAAGAYVMPGSARGSSHPYASYGQAAGAHPVASGAFADSVMITVTY